MDSRSGVWQCTRLVVRYCTHSVRARTQLRPSPVACAGVRACMRVRVRRVRMRRVLAANAGRLGSPERTRSPGTTDGMHDLLLLPLLLRAGWCCHRGRGHCVWDGSCRSGR